MTTRHYIRTVTEVRPEWCVISLRSTWILVSELVPRLLKYAANYFDLSSFPEGETKRALQLVFNKKFGKLADKVKSSGRKVEGKPTKGVEARPTKKIEERPPRENEERPTKKQKREKD